MATYLCSKLGDIDHEKLLQYRATFICQYRLCCCIVWPSFFFYCFIKIWATCENFGGNGLPPPWQKIARTPMHINTRMLCPLIFKFFWQYIQKVIHTNLLTFPYGLFYGNVQVCLHRKRKLKLINFSHK